MIKRLFLFFSIIISTFSTFGQNEQHIVDWINKNAISIENADPNSPLIAFNKNIPAQFENAKLFGFGEASHHGKEFFDIKAKFFKYLVKHQNVKVFIMEDSYISESGINEWIQGVEGNIENIAQNFKKYIWYCKEIVNLLQWMRDYNLSVPKDQQIQFFGMDIQYITGINTILREVIEKYNIPIPQELLSTIDKCAGKTIDYNKNTNWADQKIPKLEEAKAILTEHKNNNSEITATIRGLDYLIKHTYYVQYPKSIVRDRLMFENVKWILENKSSNGKAFIWAHNEHINTKEMLSYGSGWTNLGSHLKNLYKDDYYSVGFDFGRGTLRGYDSNANRMVNFQVTKPFSKTYANTLYKAKGDIYFIDFLTAKESVAGDFFDKKKRQLVLGGPGYNPKKKTLITKKLSEMYDGFIFVKSISVPDYNLN